MERRGARSISRSRKPRLDDAATQGAFADGFELYSERQDKDWSLTDCISLAVMKERGLTEVLTGDHHFEQAGVKALLAKLE